MAAESEARAKASQSEALSGAAATMAPSSGRSRKVAPEAGGAGLLAQFD